MLALLLYVSYEYSRQRKQPHLHGTSYQRCQVPACAVRRRWRSFVVTYSWSQCIGGLALMSVRCKASMG